MYVYELRKILDKYKDTDTVFVRDAECENLLVELTEEYLAIETFVNEEIKDDFYS